MLKGEKTYKTRHTDHHVRVDWELYPGPEMKPITDWSSKVYRRDRWTCQTCGSTDNLEAHHIYPVKTNPDRAKEVKNGVTLCHRCHTTAHNVHKLKKKLGLT